MYGTERRLKTVGRYPEKSLKEARKDAQAFLVGDKPSPNRLTVLDAISAFLEHSGRHNRPRTTADYKRLLNRHLPSGKLADLTKLGLLERFGHLASTPAEQSHALTAVNVFLNWCSASGHIGANPLLGVRGVGRIKQRERVLSADELKTVFNLAFTYGYPFGPLVALCIATGQRRGEVVQFHRSYFGDDTITLPKEITKNGREHTFPIGTLTKEIIGTIPDTGDLLFPGRDSGHFKGFSKSKAAFDPLSEQWQLHDLRRTFASKHAEIGTPIHIIEKLLNHVSGTFAGVVGTYNRHTYLPEMREACWRYEDFLQSLRS